MELIRFFLVSLGGVVLDIAIAYAIATQLGTPLWLAAAIGFMFAACVNYFLHELWTFHRETTRLSSKHAFYYLVTSGIILSTRLIVIASLSAWLSGDHTLAILIGSTTISFSVNYIISKYLIFARRTENEGNF